MSFPQEHQRTILNTDNDVDEASSVKQEEENKSIKPTTKASDLSDTFRSIHIVTTASLPWLTGTAVNPLLRALYFQKRRTGNGKVTLVIPWVVKEKERLEVYPEYEFANGKMGRKQQEELIRKWIVEKAGMGQQSNKLRIQFYPATYQKKLGSILTLVDICSLIPDQEADVAILEEPEHLNWFSMPLYSQKNERRDDFIPSNDIGWTAKFQHVVGIIHTNYPAYARAGVMRGSRTIASRTIHALSKLVCRSYCHKIIKLSDTLPVFADYKECVCNVHGVRSDFIQEDHDDVDDTETTDENHNVTSTQQGKKDGISFYFIGKILWAKGFQYLLDCEEKFRESTGEYFPIDIFGGGPDLEQVKRAFFGVRSMSIVEREKDHNSVCEDGSNVQENGNISENGTCTTGNDEDGDGYDDDDDDDANGTNAVKSVLNSQEHETSSVGETHDEDRHESKVESAYVQLSQIMLKYMPFLEDEMKYEENESSSSTSSTDKLSTLQTLKDGLHLVKSFQKETLLKKMPKNKYEWRKTPVPARFLGPKDHAALKCSAYKVFVNPSVTEVLCTTSAEALAMGKFVIMPKHPSNEFFYQFPNCLTYETMDEFVKKIKYAIDHDPLPLTKELKYMFTWEAAMERLIQAAAITDAEWDLLERTGKTQRDKRKAWIHKESRKMFKGDILKSIIGDLPKEDLKDYEIDGNGDGREQQLLNSTTTVQSFWHSCHY
jgi:Glycosyltransferase